MEFYDPEICLLLSIMTGDISAYEKCRKGSFEFNGDIKKV
jgi:hypothetical protein